MFKCMKCEEEMLTNSFICKKCEYWIGKGSHKTNKRRLVSNQNDREKSSNTTFSENESAYWSHAHQTRPHNEEGEIIEDEYSNPDSIADKSNKFFRRGLQYSKCIFCEALVLRRWDEVDSHVHDSCWSVFKGQMMKEIY